MMSDDASCPEGCIGAVEEKEQVKEWKYKMAESIGLNQLTSAKHQLF
jgi:hypothetical protein